MASRYNNNQDIIFASKNVTTTNININVSKTTSNNDSAPEVKEYSNINISHTNHETTIAAPADEIEIEPVAPNAESASGNMFESFATSTQFKPLYNDEDDDDEDIEEEDLDSDIVSSNREDLDLDDDLGDDDDYTDDEDDDDEDDDENVDVSQIKDEAPRGGIEDLLKALLNDD